MSLRKLDDHEWGGYFNRIARAIEGRQVDMEVSGPGLTEEGPQRAAPVMSVCYDAKDNVLMIAGEGLNQLIRGPREVYVDDQPDGLHCVDIIDAQGQHETLRLKTPLELPETRGAAGDYVPAAGEPTE